MPERAHLSIGEVLSLLREEFPDVTISKIRFLESQGLVDPERTPSGYRKFYEHDVERLRWILRQQREHFLPLKVIKGRLRAGTDGEGEEFGAGELPFPYDPPPAAPGEPGGSDAPEETAEAAGSQSAVSSPAASPAGEPGLTPAARSSEVAPAAAHGDPVPAARHSSPNRRRASTATAPVPIISRAGTQPPSPGPRPAPSPQPSRAAAPAGSPKPPLPAPGPGPAAGSPAAPSANSPAAPPAASPAATVASAPAAPPAAGAGARSAPLTPDRAAAPIKAPEREAAAPPKAAQPAVPGGAGTTERTPPRSASGPPEPAAAKAAEAVPANAGGPPAAEARPGKASAAPVKAAPSTAAAKAPGPAPTTNAEDTFTRDELAVACGIEVEQIVSLEQFGLISATTVAGTPCFDRDALAITKAAAGLAGFGVEARHLRAWRNAADREASLFEQVVLPLVRQRNPQARQKAAVALEDLSRYGGELHAALLHRALRDLR